MTRFSSLALVLLAPLMIPGCPIFPDDGLCARNADCAPGLVCQLDTGICVGEDASVNGPRCTHPAQCETNETCGEDGMCHAGDCTFHGCVEGFVCVADDLVWQCVVEPGSGGAGGAPAAGGSGNAGSGTGGAESGTGGSSVNGGAAGAVSGQGGAAGGAG
jgi:hypothetical protein